MPVAAELIRRTDADHEHLDELMAALEDEVAALRAERPAARAGRADPGARRPHDAHLDFEDSDVLPLFERHFDAEEYDALDARGREVGSASGPRPPSRCRF